MGSDSPLNSLTVTTDYDDIELGDTVEGYVVKTVNDQTYNGPVSLYDNDATLTSSEGNITFNGEIYSYLDGEDYTTLRSLTTNSFLDTTFTGNVYDIHDLNVNITGDDGVINLNGVADGGNDFVDPLSDAVYAASVNSNPITSGLTGQLIETQGSQDYNGTVVLNNNAELQATENITFDGEVHGAAVADQDNNHSSLYTYAWGDTTFNYAVGVGAGDVLARLVVSAAGNIYLNGTDNADFLKGSDGSGQVINTSGRQYYNGDVVLGNDTQLNANYSDITFDGMVNSSADNEITDGNSLELNARYDINFNDYVGAMSEVADGDATALGSLKATVNNGAIYFNGKAIVTLYDQDYNGPVLITNGMLWSEVPFMESPFTLAGSYYGDVNFNGTVGSPDGEYGLYAAALDGDVTFNDVVGGNDNPLADLFVGAYGDINLNGSYITTVNDQMYDGHVVLETDNTLVAGGDITFEGTVDSSASDQHSLTATAATISFKGDVGVGTTNSELGSLTANADTIRLGADSAIFINTSNYQIYNGPVIIANDATLTGYSVRFLDTVDGETDGKSNLTLDADINLFDGAVGSVTPLTSLTVTSSIRTRIAGGSIETAGSQDYTGTVVLSNDTTLTAGDAITFNDMVQSQQDFNLSGGYVGAGLTTESQNNTTFNGRVGTLRELKNLTVNVTGENATINLNGGVVVTYGNQDYNGNVVLGTENSLWAGEPYEIEPVISNIDFRGTIDSLSYLGDGEQNVSYDYSFDTHSTGDTTFHGAVGSSYELGNLYAESVYGYINIQGGEVTTNGDQYYDGDVVISLKDAVLNSYASEGNDALGDIYFYHTVTAGELAGSTPKVGSFQQDPGTNAGLTVNADNSINFNDYVGVTYAGLGDDDSFDLAPTHLAYLNVNAGYHDLAQEGAWVNGNINLNGGLILTDGNQDYTGTVNVNSEFDYSYDYSDNYAFIMGSYAGNITFNNKLESPEECSLYALALDGKVTFNDYVGKNDPLVNLLVYAADGIHLNGGYIETNGDQEYTGSVVLDTDNGLYADGDITFNGTVDSSHHTTADGDVSDGYSLTATAASVTFNGDVGIGSTLGNLNVTANDGTINLNGTIAAGAIGVNTSGYQEYNGAVVLGGDATLLSSGDTITFNGTVDSSVSSGGGSNGNSLTATAEAVTFNGDVGIGSTLGSLTVTAPTINLNGSDGAIDVLTFDNQLYNGAVILGGDASLQSGADITFNGTVDSSNTPVYGVEEEAETIIGYDSDVHNLTADASGSIYFKDAVGSDYALGDLYAGVSEGRIHIQGGLVRTYGDQYYAGDVRIGHSDLQGRGNTVLLAGKVIYDLGEQVYGSDIVFDGKLDSYNNYSLLVNADNDVYFEDAVGSDYELGNLLVRAGYRQETYTEAGYDTEYLPGQIHIHGGSIDTLGSQLYRGDTRIGMGIGNGGDTTLTAGDIVEFLGKVDSYNHYNLTIDAGFGVAFVGAVGSDYALGSLAVTAEEIILAGGIINTVVADNDPYTSGDQTYNGAVILGADADLNAGGDITFNGTVDSFENSDGQGYTLDTYSDGDTSFNGDVGNGYQLGNLYVEVGENGLINLNGSHVSNGAIDVHTSGDQVYTGSVRLGGDAYLTALVYDEFGDIVDGGAITFNGTVDSSDRHGRDLTTLSYYDTSFFGNVGDTYNKQNTQLRLGNFDVESLTGEIYLGNPDNPVFVNTYENQSYTVASDRHVYLSGDAWLNSSRGGITFNAMVESENYSDLNTYSWLDTDFNGDVGYDVGDDQDMGDLSLGNLYAEIGSSSGRIHLSGTAGAIRINTYGDQEYNGNVHVGKDVKPTGEYDGGTTMLTSSEGSISFDGTVNSYNHYDLDVNSDRDTTFWGAVGEGAYALGNLSIHTGLFSLGHLPGSIVLRGGLINTNGDQYYEGAVLLGADTYMIANAGSLLPPEVAYSGEDYVSGDITFENTVDSEWGNRYGLTTQSAGSTWFNDNVGDAVNGQLGYLTAGSNGYIELNGGDITTSGAQNYNGDVWLDVNTYMTTEDNDIAFSGTLNGERNLNLETGDGNITLGTVGNDTPLSYNFINFGEGSGIITLNGNVTSNGDQTYTRDVVIGHGITLDSSHDYTDNQVGFQVSSGYDNGGNISFYGTVNGTDGAASGLTLNSGSGDVEFDGAVGYDAALTSLAIEGTGTTYLYGVGSVNTTGAQTYEQAVEFHGDTAFNTSGGAVTFGDALNGRQETDGFSPQQLGYDYDLDINAKTGNITLDGEVNAGDITLAGNRITWNADLSGADLDIRGTNLVMNGDVTASGEEGALMLAVDSFKNSGRHGIDGKYLVYSVSPTRNVKGGLGGSEQFGTTYVGGPAPAFSGSGFLYSIPAQLTFMNQHTYEGINNVIRFDVPQPGAGTHGGGYFSVIDTPTDTREYRENHKKKKDGKKGGQTSSAVGVFTPGRFVLASLSSQGNPVLLQGQE